MKLFTTRHALLHIKVFLAVLISIMTITLDHRYHYLDSVRSVLFTVVYPLKLVVGFPLDTFNRLSSEFSARQELGLENRQLRNTQLRLNAELQKLRVLERENIRLQTLLHASVKLRDRFILARVININLPSLRQQVEINRGSLSGVEQGQAVVNSGGIVGQVLEVGLSSSIVLLITDPAHGLPVQVNRNGLRAILEGRGPDQPLQLGDLPTHADIHEGDLIVTSGLGRHFPSGYPVGIVSKVYINPAKPFAEISVMPSVDINMSRELLVVQPE